MGHRRHRRSKVTRVVNLVKRIIAFFFSHVGLCALVIGYALLGAVVFRAVEGPHETFIQSEVTRARQVAVDVAWNATFSVNKLDKQQWEHTVFAQTKLFQRKCMWAIRRGYDGKEYGVSAQWTFTGAFLYSLTVITTIGYGNTAAKTYFGKTLTILFAIIGIPLMLLFLTNIGDVLAKVFRFLYARSIRLKYNLILWHKKRRAAKIRRANSLVAKLTRASNNRTYFGPMRGVHDDYSLESLGAGLPMGGVTASDVHELLAYNTTRQLEARAQLDQLEVKESVEAQLQRISVPLSLVLLTMLAYLVAGSILFCLWEGWTFLDSFYFCYISLTTIGFGDKFPGASVGNDKEAQEKLVITSIYLLFGMALLAMSFNLAQEEVVNKVAWLANQFGSKDDDEYD
ncbi:ion channel domain-containing protein [Ditylenchus destructor]|uniref:Ion channel domain-containing protein n=1 Tax=Ditylenchus destructor TaxID=166010 RepID=A0AAD4R122_9BILA|nr:ion channel domain-containing protein [Ditylenchus destructor]